MKYIGLMPQAEFKGFIDFWFRLAISHVVSLTIEPIFENDQDCFRVTIIAKNKNDFDFLQVTFRNLTIQQQVWFKLLKVL